MPRSDQSSLTQVHSTSTQLYAVSGEVLDFVADVSHEDALTVLAYESASDRPRAAFGPSVVSPKLLTGVGVKHFVLVEAGVATGTLTSHQIYEQTISAVFVDIGVETNGVLTESQVSTRTFSDETRKIFQRIQKKLRRLTTQGAWVTCANVREFYRNLRYTNGALTFAKQGGILQQFSSESAPVVDLLSSRPKEIVGRVVEHFSGATWNRVKQ